MSDRRHPTAVDFGSGVDVVSRDVLAPAVHAALRALSGCEGRAGFTANQWRHAQQLVGLIERAHGQTLAAMPPDVRAGYARQLSKWFDAVSSAETASRPAQARALLARVRRTSLIAPPVDLKAPGPRARARRSVATTARRFKSGAARGRARRGTR